MSETFHSSVTYMQQTTTGNKDNKMKINTAASSVFAIHFIRSVPVLP